MAEEVHDKNRPRPKVVIASTAPLYRDPATQKALEERGWKVVCHR